MAFFSPFLNSSKISEAPGNNSSASVFKSVMCHTDSGQVDDLDTFEEELTENLTVIGYKDEFAVEMAQAISFCICNRLPILLGENATALAKCVAATIGGEELTEVFVGGQSTVIESLYKLMEGKRADYPLVYLVHGVFDGYSNNLFNEISNLTRNTSLNTVVFLSLQGIAPNMIINSVWSEAFYIDGDSGIERISDGPVHAVNPVMEFTREIDMDEYEASRKELRSFSSVLSNIQDDKTRLVQAYRKIIKTTMFVTANSMFFLGAISVALIHCLIGSKWHDAATYLPLICITGSLYPLHAINLNMLQVQGRSDLFLGLEVVKKIIAIGPLCVGAFVGIMPMLWVSIITSLFNFFLNSYYSGKLIGYTSWMQIKDIAPSYLIAIIVALSVYFLKYLPFNNWSILFIQLLAGGLVFLLLCKCMKNPEYIEIKGIANEYLKKIRRNKNGENI